MAEYINRFYRISASRPVREGGFAGRINEVGIAANISLHGLPAELEEFEEVMFALDAVYLPQQHRLQKQANEQAMKEAKAKARASRR